MERPPVFSNPLHFHVHSASGSAAPGPEVLGSITVAATYIPAGVLSDGKPSWHLNANLHCDDAPSLRALAAHLIKQAKRIEAATATAVAEAA